MAKKTDKVYSLLNVVYGNILSGNLNGLSYSIQRRKEHHTRRRNWKLSQFQVGDRQILDFFINDKKMECNWSMGTHEIWLKEEDIDLLYGALALSVLYNFTRSWENQKIIFGAFILKKDPKEFLERSFTSTAAIIREIQERQLGKEFLTFLEASEVLSFNRGGHVYTNGRWTVIPENRSFFSVNEVELICKERQEIVTIFECDIEHTKK